MTSNDPRPTFMASVVSVADLPDPPPCCQVARESGYRAGYKDGYTYAFCDAGRKLSGGIWARFWRFRTEVLLPWMRRSWDGSATRENGPRFRPADQRRRTEVSQPEESVP